MAGDAITCPKCGGEMPSRERNGVTIEQCSDCHGIYLDPGEFERLINAESAILTAPADPPPEERPTPATLRQLRAAPYFG